jgi:hypothetical protein
MCAQLLWALAQQALSSLSPLASLQPRLLLPLALYAQVQLSWCQIS